MLLPAMTYFVCKRLTFSAQASYSLIDELNTSHREYLVNARKKVIERCADKEKDEPTEEELRELVEAEDALKDRRSKRQRVIQKMDEKVAIASQSYDIIDHHIRRLDQDLEAYAALLKQNGEYEDDKALKKQKKLAQQVATPVKKQAVPTTTTGRKRSVAEIVEPVFVVCDFFSLCLLPCGCASPLCVLVSFSPSSPQQCRWTCRSIRTNQSIAVAVAFRTAK